MRMASIKSAAKAFFSAADAFLPEEAALVSAAMRDDFTVCASFVMSASRLRGSASRNACATFCSALEDFCRAHEIERATIFGGVGSTVGAVFQDGSVVEPFVTELLIRSGRIVSGPQGHALAELDVAMVDYKAGISEGRLARGSNPILVTAELVICPN
jgi:hypothetical protein